jgi:hypothetical protein
MQKSQKVQKIRSDRGGEYLSSEFNDWLKRKGTDRDLTVHDSSPQNAVSEHISLNSVGNARAMLIAAKLPRSLWILAIQHAVWIKNWTTRSSDPLKTPHECSMGLKPDFSNVPIFGQHCWVHVEAPTKMDKRAVHAQWVGFSVESKGHLLYWPDKHKVSTEHNVFFEPTTIGLVHKEVLDLPMPADYNFDFYGSENEKNNAGQHQGGAAAAAPSTSNTAPGGVDVVRDPSFDEFEMNDDPAAKTFSIAQIPMLNRTPNIPAVNPMDAFSAPHPPPPIVDPPSPPPDPGHIGAHNLTGYGNRLDIGDGLAAI